MSENTGTCHIDVADISISGVHRSLMQNRRLFEFLTNLAKTSCFNKPPSFNKLQIKFRWIQTFLFASICACLVQNCPESEFWTNPQRSGKRVKYHVNISSVHSADFVGNLCNRYYHYAVSRCFVHFTHRLYVHNSDEALCISHSAGNFPS